MANGKATKQVPCLACPLLACVGLNPPDTVQREWLQTFKSGEAHLERGEPLLAQGSWTTGVFTLLSGVLVRFRLLEDGRRQILNFMFPGDLVGLQGAFDEPLGHGVEALTAATLCHFPRDRFFELVTRHPRLAFDVTWLAAKEEAALEGHLVSLGQRSARERIAYLALFLVQRAIDTGVARDGVLEMTVTQSQIADMLGLSLVHTNRTLQGLRRDRLVLWNLATIEIPDMERARAFAHFEETSSQRPYI